jgi:hypothetical protein
MLKIFLIAITAIAPSLSAATSKSSFNEAMRKLWTDHVVYTRLYIISAVNGTADATPTLNRLMKNQEDIGNAIAPYYGSAAAAKLTDLLKQHIAIAGDLVAAAKAGDTAKRRRSPLAPERRRPRHVSERRESQLAASGRAGHAQRTPRAHDEGSRRSPAEKLHRRHSELRRDFQPVDDDGRHVVERHRKTIPGKVPCIGV